jgi:hypothetical protein
LYAVKFGDHHGRGYGDAGRNRARRAAALLAVPAPQAGRHS